MAAQTRQTATFAAMSGEMTRTTRREDAGTADDPVAVEPAGDRLRSAA